MAPALPERIVLTGFMATGKSTVGRLLAERLGYRWIDTDAVIEKRHGTIADIFAHRGEPAFREMERFVAADVAGETNVVVSTGGGMMLDESTADLLATGARVFCLTADAEAILERVTAQGETRPLLTTEDPVAEIGRLLAARTERYARFEQIDTSGCSVNQVVDGLVARLEGDAG